MWSTLQNGDSYTILLLIPEWLQMHILPLLQDETTVLTASCDKTDVIWPLAAAIALYAANTVVLTWKAPLFQK